MVAFGQKCLYSGKSCCIRVSGCNRGKLVVCGQSGCIPEKVVVFGQFLLYEGKSGCILAKVVVFGKK